MKKLFVPLYLFLFIPHFILSQTITEKEIFNLKYKGTADSYNFKFDSASGNYCYVYTIPGENKSFVISNNTLSDKYDYIVPDDIKFDSQGNYYVIASDYKAEYGTNNYFLIMNGKEIKNGNYMESYNCYVNKNNEFVFIFKDSGSYVIGYYNPETGLRQSVPYDNVRPAYSYRDVSAHTEGEAVSYKEEDFYHNEKGERAFIATVNGKTKIIFETSEIATNYSDINETSLTMNKNNELSYFAKKSGRFYELYGNEFVVSGSKEYDRFEITTTPLLFNDSNEPVYIAGDSVSEDKIRYFLVVGNQIQDVYMDQARSEKAPDFGSYISEVKINDNGSMSYIGNSEIMIPAAGVSPSENSYDQYYTRTFFVNGGIASELGYNINRVEYNDSGDMLYSGMADLQKKENLLMLNYGESKIIINKKMFDEIYEYGFTPTNEIYYVGQTYADSALRKEFEASLYIGDKLLDKNSYFVFQADGENSSILKFDDENNYAFVMERKLDTANSEYVITTNSGKLPFPQNVSGSKMFVYVSNLMFVNDELFYIGDMKVDPASYEVTKEVFYDNKSLGKTYNLIYNVDYNDVKDQITFLGSRGSKIYLVTIQL